MSIEGVHFLGGMELEDGTLILSGYETGVDMAEDPHTLLIVGQPDELDEDANTAWLATCSGANGRGDRLVIISRYGRYVEYSPHGHRSGVVDDDGEVEYRSVDVVDGEVYASGGSGTVRRLDDDGWVDESDGLSAASLLEAVTGFSRDEIYAFGWSGEIQLRENGTWREIESPTDLLLQAATTVGDRVYASGQLGVVIEGRHDEWEVHREDGGADIWSAVGFDGSVYFSSISGIERLGDDGLEKMDTSDLKTTTRLFKGPSGLWSVGGGTLGLYDGDAWQCVLQT